MNRPFYMPKRRMGEDEADFRLMQFVPKPKQGDGEKLAIKRMKDDLEYATECARNGEIAWANSYYASIKRKAAKSEFGNELADGLYRLNRTIDEAMEKRYAASQPTIEKITIFDPHFEEAPQETQKSVAVATKIFGEEYPTVNEERSEKPDYGGWEEAAEASGYKQ